jgi:hypothetical protein
MVNITPYGPIARMGRIAFQHLVLIGCGDVPLSRLGSLFQSAALHTFSALHTGKVIDPRHLHVEPFLANTATLTAHVSCVLVGGTGNADQGGGVKSETNGTFRLEDGI